MAGWAGEVIGEMAVKVRGRVGLLGNMMGETNALFTLAVKKRVGGYAYGHRRRAISARLSKMA